MKAAGMGRDPASGNQQKCSEIRTAQKFRKLTPNCINFLTNTVARPRVRGGPAGEL